MKAFDQIIKVYSPAKVNFFLKILKKLPSGYHQLRMDLIPIGLFDELIFEPAEYFTLDCSGGEEIPEEQNLVYKAVKKLEGYLGKEISVKITLKKQIPSGAGLGGGSSNAAATLKTLIELFDIKIIDSELSEIAKSLGADVPFFLNPVPSIAEGIGEKLSPISHFPKLYMVLLSPKQKISTAEAYSLCKPEESNFVINDYSLENLKSLSMEKNDFWTVLKASYPVLQEAVTVFEQFNPIMTGLSGSGSTIYAVFKDQKTQVNVYNKLNKTNLPYRDIVCSSL